MRRQPVIGVIVALVVLASARGAEAQPWLQRAAPRFGSIEVGGGLFFPGSVDFGERRGEQTRNPTTGSGAFNLFVTDSTLQASPGGQAHLTLYLTRTIGVEAGVRYAKPRLRVRISADAEGADDVTAEEEISQYQFDGSLVLHLPNLPFGGGRVAPFVLGGAGHIRELHEGDELVETGTAVHGGGGIKWWFGAGRRRLGLRAEARVTSRAGGFDLREDRRTVPSGAVSAVYLF